MTKPQASPSPQVLADLSRVPLVYSRVLVESARRHGVEQAVIAAMMRVGSNFDPGFNHGGRVGLLAVPSERIAGRDIDDLMDSRVNIDAGVAHLRELLDRYSMNVVLALAAYRAGIEPVDQYGGIPPDEDVREYIHKVLRARQGYLQGFLREPEDMAVLPAAGRDVLARQEIARRAARAAVTVRVSDGKKGGVQGSGFAVTRNLVVTNAHVVGKHVEGVLSRNGSVGTSAFDEVVAVDKEADLAVLHVGDTLPAALPLAASGSVEVGDQIYVMGSPTGLEGTFSEGMISSIREVKGIRYLQIDAPISPGSSGSPVLDEYGNVVGIVVSTLRGGQNLNFAVATSHLWSLLEKTGWR